MVQECVGRWPDTDRQVCIQKRDTMAYVADKKQILKILVENLSNDHPQIVEAELIAEKLNMSGKEISRIVKMMEKGGEVESDPEGQRLVITKEGLHWMNEHSRFCVVDR